MSAATWQEMKVGMGGMLKRVAKECQNDAIRNTNE